jgi:hypothetical protein
MIASIPVQLLFQRRCGQAQSLAPRRHFQRFQIQVGERLAP